MVYRDANDGEWVSGWWIVLALVILIIVAFVA